MRRVNVTGKAIRENGGDRKSLKRNVGGVGVGNSRSIPIRRVKTAGTSVDYRRRLRVWWSRVSRLQLSLMACLLMSLLMLMLCWDTVIIATEFVLRRFGGEVMLGGSRGDLSVKAKKSGSGAVSVLKEELSALEASSLLRCPVTKLSNGVWFPLLGLGCGTADHRKIPVTVASVLSHATSEQGVWGGIALLDTDYSDQSNLPLVVRAILHVAQDRAKQSAQLHTQHLLRHHSHHGHNTHKPVPQTLTKSPHGLNYDYEHRLEVHVLTHLPCHTLDLEAATRAIQDYRAELAPVLSPPDNNPQQPLSQTHLDVRLHVLLHCPSCNHQQQHTNATDCPHTLDALSLQTYTAMEQMLTQQQIHSIGVANLSIQQLNQLITANSIKPQFYQGSIRQALLDQPLQTLLRHHDILFQAYNVFASTLLHKHHAPIAYEALQLIATHLYQHHHQSDTINDFQQQQQSYSISTIILAHLTQHNISAIPKSTSQDHLADNAPSSIQQIPPFSPRTNFEIETCLKAILTQTDLPPNHNLAQHEDDGVVVTFTNTHHQNVLLKNVLFNQQTDIAEVALGDAVPPEESVKFVVNPGDQIVVYNEDGEEMQLFLVTASHGEQQHFRIDVG